MYFLQRQYLRCKKYIPLEFYPRFELHKYEHRVDWVALYKSQFIDILLHNEEV